MKYKEKERSLDSRLQKLISRRTPDYIVEVGSFDGEVLRQFSLSSPYSRAIGFEANPKNFFRYCLGKNIQNIAISNKKGFMKFYVNKNPRQLRSGSIFIRENDTEDQYDTYNVLTTTLDDFFKLEIERNKSFVLIIDAEGAAWEVLAGARQLLKKTLALKVEAEEESCWQNQKMIVSVNEFLDNFVLKGINLPVKNKASNVQKNYYYINKDSPGSIIDFDMI